MNRFGNGQLPELEMVPDQAGRLLTHEDIERDIAEFFARGGKPSPCESRRLECERLDRDDRGPGTTRRWKNPPPPRSALDADMAKRRYPRRSA